MDLLAVMAGFGVGAIVGVTGVGRGSLMTPLLMGVFKLDAALAISHATLGHVDWALLAALLAGSLPGIWLGARLTRAMPERLVRSALCISPLGAGIKVLN